MAEENTNQVRKPEGPVTTVGKFVLGEDAFGGEIPFTTGVKYGDKEGSLIVNPLTTDKLLNFKEYFQRHDFEEQDFDLGGGKKLEGVRIRSYALPNGERVQINEADDYETIMNDFNQVNPSTLYLEDRNGNIIDALDVNTEIDAKLRANIKAKIKEEQKGLDTGLGFRISTKPKLPPNPLTGVANPFDVGAYYKKDETGELLPTLDKSIGREAQNFLDFVDEQMPNMKAATVAKLVNRNIYGRVNLTFKPPQKGESGRTKTTLEKFYYQASDLPRAYADFALLIFGGVGELGYRGFDTALRNLPIEGFEGGFSTDRTEVLPQPTGPFSSKGRETIMSYLGPDAVERYRQALAQDNILVTKDQARKLLNYTRDAAESGQVLLPQFLGEVKVITSLMKKLPFFGNQEDEFKKFKQYQIDNPNIKPQDMLDAYLKDNPLNVLINNSFTNYLRKGRIKEGSQILESTLPLEKRSLVVDAESTVKTAKENLKKEIKIQNQLRATAKVKYKNAAILKQDSDEVVRAKAKLQESLMRKRLIERESGTPQYVRDAFRDTATFATIAAVSGQTMQEIGYDKDLGMLLGFGGVLGYSLLHSKTGFEGPLVQRYLDVGQDRPIDVFKYLSSAELGDFKNKKELYESLINPDLQRLANGTSQQKKQYKLAVKVSNILRGLNPEVQEQIVANIQYYNGLKDSLVKLGVPSELLNKSFANMSGMGFLDALEDSFVYSINQMKTLDTDTSKQLMEFENRRNAINTELGQTLRSVLSLPNLDKNNQIIIDFVDKLNTGLEYSKGQLQSLRGIQQNYTNAKAVALKRLMSGVPDEGTQTFLNSMTGIDNPTDLMKELFEELVSERVVDFQKAADLAPTIATARDDLISELHYNLDAFDQRTTEQAGKIPAIQQTKLLKSEKGKKAKVEITSVDIGKYNNENASLGRAFMVNFHSAKAQASVPFKAFDAKYAGNYATDATDLGLKILDDVRASAGDKASKNLVGQSMKNSDMRDIFAILDDSAGDTLKLAGESLENPNFRQNYVEKIREEFDFKGTVTNLDIFGYIRDTDPQLFQKLGFALSMTDTQRLRSALGSRSVSYKNAADNQRSSAYYEYYQEADKLYDNIITADGLPAPDDVKLAIQSDIKEARTYAKTFFYDRYINKGSRLRKWAMPSTKELDNAQTPGGNAWTPENEPKTWFDLGNITDNDLTTKNSELRNMFATDISGQGDMVDYIIKPDSENAKFLKQLSNIKFKRQVKVLAKTISDPAKFREELLNLRTRTEQVFRLNPFNKSQTAFDFDETMDQITDLQTRYFTDQKVAKIIDDGFTKEFSPKLLQEGNKIANVQRKMDDNVRLLTRLSDNASEQSFFQNFVLDPKGAENLKAAKDSAVKSGAIDSVTFDETVKEIVARQISKSTMRPTGKIIVQKDLKKDKFGKQQIDKIEEMRLDVDGLLTILNNDTAMTNLISGKYLSQDQIDNLKLIAQFIKKDQKPINANNLSFTGDPRGLSIESYISRFYSISRGVVSPRYVFTEALIQNIRMKDHRMLQEMLTNEEVGGILADMFKEGKKFTEAKELRLKEILLQMSVNANVAYAGRVEAEMKKGQRKPLIDMSKLQ